MCVVAGRAKYSEEGGEGKFTFLMSLSFDIFPMSTDVDTLMMCKLQQKTNISCLLTANDDSRINYDETNK